MKRALSGGELLEVIKEVDIMGVGETWLREGEEIIMKNYIFEGKSKEKVGNKGRVPGGLGVLIRKEVKKRIIWIRECSGDEKGPEWRGIIGGD